MTCAQWAQLGSFSSLISFFQIFFPLFSLRTREAVSVVVRPAKKRSQIVSNSFIMADLFLDYAAGTAVFIKVIHPQTRGDKTTNKVRCVIGPLFGRHWRCSARQFSRKLYFFSITLSAFDSRCRCFYCVHSPPRLLKKKMTTRAEPGSGALNEPAWQQTRELTRGPTTRNNLHISHGFPRNPLVRTGTKCALKPNFSAIALIMGRCLATNKRFLLLRTAAILKMFAILALKELVDDSIWYTACR